MFVDSILLAEDAKSLILIGSRFTDFCLIVSEHTKVKNFVQII